MTLPLNPHDATGSYFNDFEANRTEELQNYIRRRLSQGATQWEIEQELSHREVPENVSEELIRNAIVFRKGVSVDPTSFEEHLEVWTSADQKTKCQNDRNSPAAVNPAIPPELVWHARYRATEQLGQGGMGAVYKAEHLVMERPVALKVIHSSLVKDAAAIERFQREVRAVARLDHPNIVRAYDADRAGDLHFLVMEIVDGKSLADVLKQRGPFPIWLACDVIRQAAIGLQHAHSNGMVHRDIKPHNIMLTREGSIKLLDFGLARLACDMDTLSGLPQGVPDVLSQLTKFGIMMGTPDYVAPEQILDARNADIRADIYSLGCTAYTLLTGKPPFASEPTGMKLFAHLQKVAPPVDMLRPNLPAGLAATVSKMMSKQPADRFGTPEEVQWALTSFCQELAPRRSGPAVLSPLAGLDHTTDQKFVHLRKPHRRIWFRTKASVVFFVLLLSAGIIFFMLIYFQHLADTRKKKPTASSATLTATTSITHYSFDDPPCAGSLDSRLTRRAD